MKRLATIALASVLVLGGCKTAAYVNHPGAVNTFDSQTYDTLLVTHAVIEATRADLAANKFPANVAVAVKAAANGLEQAYNVADAAYFTYHAAAAAGVVTSAQTSAVTTALANVNSSTAALAAVKGAN